MKLSNAIMNHLETKLPQMVQLFLTNGTITEEDMDQQGICKMLDSGDRRTMPKDDRVLHQQRAVLMNANAVTAKYRARQAEKVVSEARKHERERLVAAGEIQPRKKRSVNVAKLITSKPPKALKKPRLITPVPAVAK
jgi:hypothetical protein